MVLDVRYLPPVCDCGPFQLCPTCGPPHAKSEPLLVWLRDAGCNPDETMSISLNEGRFVARMFELGDDGKPFARGGDVATVVREFPCAVPPPMWKG